MQPVEHGLLFRGQIGDDAVQEERGLVQQALRRFDILDDDAAGEHVQAGIFLRGKILAGEDDDRQLISGSRSLLKLLQKLESGHVGQPQVEHHAVVALLLDRGQRFAAGGDNVDIDVVVAQQRPDTELLRRIIFDDQEALAAGTRSSRGCGRSRLPGLRWWLAW